MSVWDGYDYCDGVSWFKKLLLVLGALLGTGFTLFVLAVLAKVVVDVWTGGCAI